MNSEITLHDYRLVYPRTAPIPTLTQSGLVGLLLEREQRRASRQARRRAARQRMLALPGRALSWLSQALATARPSPAVAVAVSSARRA